MINETAQDDGVTQLQSWIRQLHPDMTDDIALDVDLIDTRLVDSLAFVTLLLRVEELRGRPLASDEIDVDNFRTLARIRDRLLTA